jgi:hypothetical protein
LLFLHPYPPPTTYPSQLLSVFACSMYVSKLSNNMNMNLSLLTGKDEDTIKEK